MICKTLTVKSPYIMRRYLIRYTKTKGKLRSMVDRTQLKGCEGVTNNIFYSNKNFCMIFLWKFTS